MCPVNAWLAELNQFESEPPPVPITAIWSRHDSMVILQASAMLVGAENGAVVGLDHNAMVSNAEVLEIAVRVAERGFSP